MKNPKRKTEIDTLLYHTKSMEAACVERCVNEPNITSVRMAKLYADAGSCWAIAARCTAQNVETYAHRRFDFCRGALIRLGRHDLVEQLENLA